MKRDENSCNLSNCWVGSMSAGVGWDEMVWGCTDGEESAGVVKGDVAAVWFWKG